MFCCVSCSSTIAYHHDHTSPAHPPHSHSSSSALSPLIHRLCCFRFASSPFLSLSFSNHHHHLKSLQLSILPIPLTSPINVQLIVQMLRFTRDKAPDRDSASINNTNKSAPAAYRRTSIPSISSFDIAPHHNLSSLPTSSSTRRAPLASLNPQTASPVFPLDYLMSSSSSSQQQQQQQQQISRSADPRAEAPSKDADRSQEPPRFAIGRPISVNRAMEEDESMQALQNTRRRSLSNQYAVPCTFFISVSPSVNVPQSSQQRQQQ